MENPWLKIYIIKNIEGKKEIYNLNLKKNFSVLQAREPTLKKTWAKKIID